MLPVLVALATIAIAYGGAMLVFARIGGWSAIASQYRGLGPGDAVVLTARTGRVGKIRYRRVFNVAVSSQGLGLFVMPHFRPFHPPVFIPWKDLNRVDGGGGGFVVFEVGQPALATIKAPFEVLGEAKQLGVVL